MNNLDNYKNFSEFDAKTQEINIKKRKINKNKKLLTDKKNKDEEMNKVISEIYALANKHKVSILSYAKNKINNLLSRMRIRIINNDSDDELLMTYMNLKKRLADIDKNRKYTEQLIELNKELKTFTKEPYRNFITLRAKY